MVVAVVVVVVVVVAVVVVDCGSRLVVHNALMLVLPFLFWNWVLHPQVMTG